MGSDRPHARRSARSGLSLIALCGVLRATSSTDDDTPPNEPETCDDEAKYGRLTPSAPGIAPTSRFGEGADAFAEVPIGGHELVDRDDGGVVGVGVALSVTHACWGNGDRHSGDNGTNQGGESAIVHLVCLPSES